MTDHEFKLEESPINNMVLSHNEKSLLISNHIGSVFNLDLRKGFQMLRKFTDADGTITHMELHATQPYLSTVSLDRYLRVYNTKKGQLVSATHTGQHLNSSKMSAEGFNKKLFRSRCRKER